MLKESSDEEEADEVNAVNFKRSCVLIKKNEKLDVHSQRSQMYFKSLLNTDRDQERR